jgi:predicted  nucleic acid-binding Zn-ribbon protein
VLSALAERVDVLDEKLTAQGPVAVPAAPPALDRSELALMSDQIGRLAAEVAQTHERVSQRFTAMDQLRSELAGLAADVGGAQQRLDEVTRMQRVQQSAMSSSPVVQSMQRSLGDLRGELATVGSRLVGLDARVDELQSLPLRMEDVAARQFRRLVPEMLSPPDDLQGLYRELERIAERMAARDEAVTQVVDRMTAVEEAVTGLRLDLDRVIGGLAAARESEVEARDWRQALERRMAALEAPGSEIERLYLALDRMVGEGAGTGGTAGTGSEMRAQETAGNGAGLLAAGPLPSQDQGTADKDRAVEALTAELERIRRSIEVLVRPGARPPSGPGERR